MCTKKTTRKKANKKKRGTIKKGTACKRRWWQRRRRRFKATVKSAWNLNKNKNVWACIRLTLRIERKKGQNICNDKLGMETIELPGSLWNDLYCLLVLFSLRCVALHVILLCCIIRADCMFWMFNLIYYILANAAGDRYDQFVLFVFSAEAFRLQTNVYCIKSSKISNFSSLSLTGAVQNE